jgi:hypothetical protein
MREAPITSSRFMKEEWPLLRSRMKRLGIELRTLAETFDD